MEIKTKRTIKVKPHVSRLNRDLRGKPKKDDMELPVYDNKGKAAGTAVLKKTIFGEKTNPRLLALYVRVYLANQRQGNASAKTRAEITGSTRKIYKQKGTGKARHSSRKAPLFVGGGVVGGPRPRDFTLRMNKKQKRKAFIYSLSLKAQERNINVLGDKVIDIEPKTKNVISLFKTLAMDNTSTLIVVPQMKTNIVHASRNIPKISLATVSNLNPYLILMHQKVVFFEKTLTDVVNLLEKNTNAN